MHRARAHTDHPESGGSRGENSSAKSQLGEICVEKLASGASFAWEAREHHRKHGVCDVQLAHIQMHFIAVYAARPGRPPTLLGQSESGTCFSERLCVLLNDVNALNGVPKVLRNQFGKLYIYTWGCNLKLSTGMGNLVRIMISWYELAIQSWNSSSGLNILNSISLEEIASWLVNLYKWKAEQKLRFLLLYITCFILQLFQT